MSLSIPIVSFLYVFVFFPEKTSTVMPAKSDSEVMFC